MMLRFLYLKKNICRVFFFPTLLSLSFPSSLSLLHSFPFWKFWNFRYAIPKIKKIFWPLKNSIRLKFFAIFYLNPTSSWLRQSCICLYIFPSTTKWMFLHSSGSNLSQRSAISGDGACCWLRDSKSQSKSSRQGTPHGPCCQQQDLRLEKAQFKCCQTANRRRKSDQTEYSDNLLACNCHKTYYHYTITGNYYTATPKRRPPLNKNFSLDETPLSRSYYGQKTRKPLNLRKNSKSEKFWEKFGSIRGGT